MGERAARRVHCVIARRAEYGRSGACRARQDRIGICSERARPSGTGTGEETEQLVRPAGLSDSLEGGDGDGGGRSPGRGYSDSSPAFTHWSVHIIYYIY